MNRIFPLLLILLPFLITGCVTDFKPPPGVHVPRNLEEAYIDLDLMFTDEEKTALRTGATPVEELVLNFGMQLKEYWGLWQDSKIAKFMHKRDIDHPDQMVMVIMRGYVNYLREKEPQG
jgi:hypothetical protein